MKEVDLMLYGGTVVTMNATRRIIADGAVVVHDGAIVAVEPTTNAQNRFAAREMVDCHDRIVIPGLINTHTHVPMSMMRGLADDLRLDVWLLGYMMPVEREFVSPQFCRSGTLLSCAEMIRSGVTCFNDMYYFEDEIAQATVEVGMRGVLGQTVLKFPTPDAESYEESLVICRKFIEQWRNHPLITPTVSPHAPYTCTEEILRTCTELALEYDVPLHIHLSETALEVQESERTLGQRPVAYVSRLGMFEARTIAAHCVHVNDYEIECLAAGGVGVAHNPTSNLKLASGVAPILKMRRKGVAVGIGTDGAGSNNDLDQFEEMRLAVFLPKGLSGDPTALPAGDAFAMATIEGARSLHLSDQIGSLEPGKRADIVVLDTSGAHATPRYDFGPGNVYSHLVYAAKSTDVLHVWVDGQQLLRDRELLTIDEEKVLSEARSIATKVNHFLSQREGNLLDKMLAVANLDVRSSPYETYEVQVKAKIGNPESIVQRLRTDPAFEQVKRSMRQQFDTYLLFAAPDSGSVRYREDNVVSNVEETGHTPAPELAVEPIYTLTLLGPTAERIYENSVILSRSRYAAQANHSLRFYLEYFQPDSVKEIVKWRERYRVRYQSEEFAINIDRLSKPALDHPLLEIKSRTWSAQDALRKAELISDLLEKFGVPQSDIVRGEYVTL